MTRQQILRIAAALGVASVLWIAVETLSRNGDRIEQIELFPQLQPDAVDSVIIARPTDTVRLARTAAGTWRVSEYAAGPDAARELFDAFDESRRAVLAARSVTSHERMGVDSAGAKRVSVLHAGERVVDLLVGRRGRDFRSVYVRPAGDDRVFLAQGRLADLVQRSPTDWRNKRIATVEPGTVHRLSVVRGAARYEITRRDGGWVLDDGSPADSARVTRLLEAFRTLTAQGDAFATRQQADSADFASPDRAVTLLNAAGDTLVALAFDSTDAGYWTRRLGSETVYQLYAWKVDELTPADSVLGAR